MAETQSSKRALILAGGGMKVAWQAGVLQVWLDEAGLEFDIFDGASGGVFQLAMLCQGLSGTQIADNWRNIHPEAAAGFNWSELPKLMYAESLFTLDSFKKYVFTGWGLAWDKIRASKLDASFNVYNFTEQRLEIIDPAQMTEDFLGACVSLPMWFPPVLIDGKRYIDAVFATDANLEEALRRGADELWVIWTVSQLSDWEPGFVATYFQIIEAAANGRYNAVLDRVRVNNENLALGRPGEFGRSITVREIKGEVPLQYLINLNADRFKEAVNMGVTAARNWCAANGISIRPEPVPGQADASKLTFTEEMKGFIGPPGDFDAGFQAGERTHDDLMFHLTISIDGVFDFVETEGKWAQAEGWVSGKRFGREIAVQKGRFNLFQDQPVPGTNEPNPIDKRMLYRLYFTDQSGQPFTLSGRKVVHKSQGSDVWHDTTTLFTQILAGHVDPSQEGNAQVIASGILRLHLLDFLKQLSTFRAEGANERERIAALTRFGTFFLGNLWDVYGRRILEYGPF